MLKKKLIVKVKGHKCNKYQDNTVKENLNEDIANSRLKDPQIIQKDAEGTSEYQKDVGEQSNNGIQSIKDMKDGEGIENTIMHASKARDLSLRHTNSLKTKKGGSQFFYKLK